MENLQLRDYRVSTEDGKTIFLVTNISPSNIITSPRLVTYTIFGELNEVDEYNAPLLGYFETWKPNTEEFLKTEDDFLNTTSPIDI